MNGIGWFPYATKVHSNSCYLHGECSIIARCSVELPHLLSNIFFRYLFDDIFKRIIVILISFLRVKTSVVMILCLTVGCGEKTGERKGKMINYAKAKPA